MQMQTQSNWDELTLGEALARSAQRFPQRLAIIDGDQRISFAQLDRRATALALGLRAQGIGRGDQVALWMTNCAAWVLCWIACARIGAVLVPINTRYKIDEVEYILKQSDARALILMDRYWDIEFLQMARQIVPELDGATPGALRSARLPELRSVIVWKDISAPGTTSLDSVVRAGEALMDKGEQLPPAHPGDAIIIV